MPEHTEPLIATIAGGLALAFILGLIAHRLRVSPIVGYLLAGVAIGPFTPGYVADQGLANQLAEIGVILLMFAVGLHFSVKDLLSVSRIAVPGAIVQIGAAVALGAGAAFFFGWSLAAGLVFGLALSVASTVVLTRALQERHILDTERGRIAVGWLVVEDLAMVLALVLLPALGGRSIASTVAGFLPGGIWTTILITLAKVAAFVAVMSILGRRAIPWLMHYTARTGSRELFRLAVYAVALGVALGASEIFGVSFALGAFAAGMVLGETPLSQRATEEALPLRDAFAVLFFVSVGMLFNPHIIVEQPVEVLATIGIILLGKSVAAYVIVRLCRQPSLVALTIAASLAQIGEFSFILAELGVSMNLLPHEGRDLILAGAIASILVNPFLFAAIERLGPRPHANETGSSEERERLEGAGLGTKPASDATPTPLADHDIVAGYGRVGSRVVRELRETGRPVIVIEQHPDALERAHVEGVTAIDGNAAQPAVLALANVRGANRLFVTVPEAFEAGQVVEQARSANLDLEIVARAHSDAAVAHLLERGATEAVMGESEIARGMLERARPRSSSPQTASA